MFGWALSGGGLGAVGLVSYRGRVWGQAWQGLFGGAVRVEHYPDIYYVRNTCAGVVHDTTEGAP